MGIAERVVKGSRGGQDGERAVILVSAAESDQGQSVVVAPVLFTRNYSRMVEWRHGVLPLSPFYRDRH
jgi:hypothetical protein